MSLQRGEWFSMLSRLFRRTADDQPFALYGVVVEQARRPALYQDYGVPDTLDGRFDMVVFHLTLVIDRLRHPDRSVTAQAQALFDLFVADMDRNLRQIGVGDNSVPRKMKNIGQSFYGRFGAYTRAKDRSALAAAVRRNVFPDGENGAAVRLADYYMAGRALLAAHSADDIASGSIVWPPLDSGIADEADDIAISDQPAAFG